MNSCSFWMQGFFFEFNLYSPFSHQLENSLFLKASKTNMARNRFGSVSRRNDPVVKLVRRTVGNLGYVSLLDGTSKCCEKSFPATFLIVSYSCSTSSLCRTKTLQSVIREALVRLGYLLNYASPTKRSCRTI